MEVIVVTRSIQDRVLLIRIPVLYEPGMAGVQLYEATRGVWRVGERRESAEYRMCRRRGMIREVYVIESWHPAGSTPYATRHQVAIAGRWEFLGRIASDDVRGRLVGRSVKEYFARGNQNPITYVNC